MQVQSSIWDSYPRDGSKFVDPLYVPYQNTDVVTFRDGVQETCPVNPYKLSLQGKYYDPSKTPQENRGATLHRQLVRTSRGRSFQLMDPLEACPVDFVKDETTGYCHQAQLPIEGTFYTKDAFVPRHQHFEGHTLKRNRSINHRYEHSPFDKKSVNPFTGRYVIYHESKPNPNRLKYGHMPMTSSLLGNV